MARSAQLAFYGSVGAVPTHYEFDVEGAALTRRASITLHEICVFRMERDAVEPEPLRRRSTPSAAFARCPRRPCAFATPTTVAWALPAATMSKPAQTRSSGPA